MVTISMTCATDNLEMERILTTCHKPTVQKLQEGDIMTLRCTDLLRGEHKLILRAAYVLEAMAGQVPADGEPNLRDVQTLLMFLRKFADNHHQGKEETVLFPALRRFELPATGPLRHMMFEHEQDRSLIDGIEDAVLSHHGANFVYYAKRLANILTTHIYKEDHILFDLAATVLTKEDDARLEREMARFDEDLDAQTREMLMESLTRLEWKYLGKTAPSV
jgi:hemerythrin-like domain-containing protein